MSKTERTLEGKCAVITGGASGIGLEIAEQFLLKGVRQVALLDLNPKAGDEAVKHLNSTHGSNKAIYFKCDVTSDDDLKEVFEKILEDCKKVDVLVNNAGILNDKNWKKCIDVNLTYLIGWSLKFFDYMRKDKSGHGGTIINVASIYGFRIDQYIPVYRASKFGVYGFTKSLGHDYNYSRTGVRVVAMCPGFTKTDMTAQDLGNVLDDKQLSADMEHFMDTEVIWQNVESVGTAAVELFEKSDSGKAWLIEGGKPICQV